ncbi:MAG: SUF system NifU family Fe-S cluster assembly protein [Spirochaetes bacterium]|nr:SUF system NifU family Fe-S cluster assembly protein [Spirochaetota bacterium]
MEFDELYQEIILDHYRNPRNFGEIDNEPLSIEKDNPVCGDHVKLMISIGDNGLVNDIKFTGEGCAICMASSSMMTEMVKDKPISEVKGLILNFLQALRGEIDDSILEEMGDLTSLKGVIKFPVRVKCAALSWNALNELISD